MKALTRSQAVLVHIFNFSTHEAEDTQIADGYIAIIVHHSDMKKILSVAASINGHRTEDKCPH